MMFLFLLGGLLITLQLLCWPVYRYMRKRQPLLAQEVFTLFEWVGWCGAMCWAIMATILLVRWLF